MTAAIASARSKYDDLASTQAGARVLPAGKAMLALGAAVMLCRIVFGAPYSIILDGLALGSLYGLIGAGVILIYRTNRIINFAAAGLGAVPAVAGVLLIVNKGITWYLAFPAAILGGAALGALVDVLVIRRFARAPRLILVVVTIGISQLLAFIALFLPRWIAPPGGNKGGFISKVDTPFNDVQFIRVGARSFSGDYPFAVFVVAILVFGLAAFFKYTRIGIALRASAENADRASLLGIPVRRVGTVAWILAGAFAAITIFLRSTLVGVPVDGTLGPIVLLFALAAAVIAKMESIPLCLCAGVAIGMIDQSSVFKTNKNSLAGAIMLVLILGALLLQRGSLSRAQDSGVSSFSAMKEFRPIPTELRGVKEVVVVRGVLMAILGVALLAAPFVLGAGRLSRATPIVIYGIIAVSIVILTGWAGQISLGQFGLVGIGAVVGGGLASSHNIDFFVALLAGTVAGAVVAVLIGLPALRIQGLYLAVTSLAFASSVSGFLLDPRYPVQQFFFTGGGASRVERPMLFQRIDLSQDRNYYYLCLFFLGLVLLSARAYRRNRAGRILIAMRDNSRAAPSYAINLARNRLAAFAVSGAFAALGGVLLAYEQGAVDQSSYGIGPSVLIFTAVVIGGVTSLPGAVFGAILIQSVRIYGESYVTGLSLLVTGPGLVFVLLSLPGGIAEGTFKVRDGFLRWVANRHDILVPSLVADKRVETGEDQQDIITSAEHHVEEQKSFDLATAPTIVCPTCGVTLALADAPEHEHLRSDDRELVAVGADGDDGPTGTGGGRRRLARAKDGRR
jgi:branched-chain amino acid transport system permease protein